MKSIPKYIGKGNDILHTLMKIPKHCVKVFVCITIDLDEHMPGDAENGIKNTIKLLDEFGILKNTTWFVNELDYNLTENYPNLMKNLVTHVGEIGVHVHFIEFEELKKGNLERLHDKEKIKNMIQVSKDRLERFLEGLASSKNKIESFRSGNLLRSKEMFEALIELGFKYDSTISPAIRSIINGIIILDDTDFHRGIQPWFLDPNDYKNTAVQKSELVEIPLTNPRIAFAVYDSYCNATRFNPNKPIVITVYWHPYNLLNDEGLPTLRKYKAFQTLLKYLQNNFECQFVTVREAGKLFKIGEAYTNAVKIKPSRSKTVWDTLQMYRLLKD